MGKGARGKLAADDGPVKGYLRRHDSWLVLALPREAEGRLRPSIRSMRSSWQPARDRQFMREPGDHLKTKIEGQNRQKRLKGEIQQWNLASREMFLVVCDMIYSARLLSKLQSSSEGGLGNITIPTLTLKKRRISLQPMRIPERRCGSDS